MRIFILCCGPSIKYQNLQCLAGETCFSVSNFFVHPLINEIKPSRHIFAPMHLRNDIVVALFNEADKTLPPETPIVIAAKDKRFCTGLSSDRKVITYDPGEILALSVSNIALYMAIQEQPQQIYLLGCDHNWIRHVGESRHFYHTSESVAERMGYDEWLGMDKKSATIREKQCNNDLFDIYGTYKEIAQEKNIQVLNATPGSRLEVFEKTTLFDIFEVPTMDDI